ncbi:arsenate reductase/protein-tyrosine-phosphatase family protein [Naasia lichenicola]|uniref:Phosphotyrosine protein phosphatase I domain-containing protein n=1 Tax=Naasia lichenicola TaxID=2565933 RepID=A0A4S4FL74_9MICO|nr:hypothetical protein [Naasia lichenicola]THG30804.1 hypothetical protein E6C64_09205 [Naasia lichenicola]
MPRILLVCTANVCRSAYASALLQEHLMWDPKESWVVESAGIRAVADGAICSMVHGRLDDVGLAEVAFSHVARQIDRSTIASADLILTAASEHRSAVVRMDPRASRRTFTLNEAAGLSKIAVPMQPNGVFAAKTPMHDFVEDLHAARPRLALDEPRGLLRRRSAHAIDISDGHNMRNGDHVHTLNDVRDAVDSIADALRSVYAVEADPGYRAAG